MTLQFTLSGTPQTLPETPCSLFGDTPGLGVAKETQGVEVEYIPVGWNLPCGQGFDLEHLVMLFEMRIWVVIW